jgi:hypothetical protein
MGFPLANEVPWVLSTRAKLSRTIQRLRRADDDDTPSTIVVIMQPFQQPPKVQTLVVAIENGYQIILWDHEEPILPNSLEMRFQQL